jgi:hypothetical protein
MQVCASAVFGSHLSNDAEVRIAKHMLARAIVTT